MKKLITLILLSYVLQTNAQDRFSLATLHSADYITEKGNTLNIGLELTAEMNWGYVALQLFHFPDLKGNDYTHLMSNLGINLNYFFDEKDFRPYIGFIGGSIYRFGNPFPTVGGEIGVDYYINNFLIGLKGTYQYRTDYVNNEFWKENIYLKIGFKL